MAGTHNEAPFPRLRAAYLRAIAEAWRDPHFVDVLVRESESNPRGVLAFLEKRYNFSFPFDVAFKISDKKRPQYRPIDTNGWWGFGDEFVLYLPKRPKDLVEGASVLGRYCAEFPSLLGAGSGAGVEAPADFANFGVVTARLLALTWHNESFSESLFGTNDARQLIQDTMNWIVPWNFLIKFFQAPGDTNDSDEYWNAFPRSVITVHLPHKPIHQMDNRGNPDYTMEPLALAAYNGTGAQYPFTCP